MNQTFLIILVAGMLFTGTINTLLNKLQDLTCVSNCDQDPSLRKHFEQPLIQTLTMFIGEFFCLILYIYKQKSNAYARIPTEASEEQPLVEGEEELIKLEGYRNFLFLIPTMCDLTSTTLMNVGLIFTSASVYQMLRGSVVLFTGLFSTLFLGTSHPTYRWIALFIVFLGVSIVGLSSLLSSSITVSSTPLGVFLVILAQGFTATQVIYR
jgi:drug/metabolite transporter (DMT)-like permease